MSVKNLQYFGLNCQEKTYNNKNMSEFNPENFAEWLMSAFRNSHYKSLSEIASIVGVSRTTMSMYAGAKPQTASNKPSRPKREICLKLAEIFGADKDFVLQLGGHAPTKPNLIIRGFDDTLDELDVKKIEEYIQFLKSQKTKP